MSDRAVAVYLIFCLAQLPLYYLWGRTPLAFDLKVEALEQRMSGGELTQEEKEQLFEEFEVFAARLNQDSIQDSRLYRLWLDQAVLSWRMGDPARTEELFQRALTGFLQTHGDDSYYVSGVRGRFGEFLQSERRHLEAAPVLKRARAGLHQALGPEDPFTLRIAIREISNLLSIGRDRQAGELAAEYAPLLLPKAGLFEEVLLIQAGQSFDRLVGRSLLYAPSSGQSWREALETARQQGRGVEEAKRTEGP